VKSVSNPTENNKLPLDLDAWKLFSNKQLEFVKLHLKKDELIDVHKNHMDVYFFVQKGEVEFVVDDETVILHEGDLFFVEKDCNRGCKGISEKTQLLVIKVFGK